jgi:hypothetical protein
MGRKLAEILQTLKEKLSTTLVLTLPYLQHPFEIQTNARKYSMGEVLMK